MRTTRISASTMNKGLIGVVVRRCFLLAVACVVSATAMASDGVIIKLKNGNEVGFVFSTKPRVAFGTELQISTSDGVSVSYEYAEVCSVSYGDVSSTSIGDVPSSSTVCDVVFKLIDGKLLVEGLPAGESVGVYTIDGKVIATGKQTDDSMSLTIPLTVGRGVLVVRTSTGVGYKVMSR